MAEHMRKRDFITVDQNCCDDDIFAAIASREREITNYDLNEASFIQQLAMMADLPDEWPGDIAKFKGMPGERVADLCPPEKFEQVTRLLLRDRIRHLLATTRIERGKSEMVYDALCCELPAGDRRTQAHARWQAKQVM